ncbi:hypothetical protein POX_h09453 [Penicillium oxalicum]|uniref:Uncharacterized protein n=1 Tax=Penicillium oxalicum (strain 114-2 / CGMCC 5302) TaxID=933388 RepID=S7ZLE9_PENO1|nr:hypothetical protein POX_h09453 [Penicillium oxalicum]EPS31154.1 hypothetical protein PDE_06109 [Penicillium oxalicum 114-2]KAI2785695.1 hypothetical protein POX_h09453 [Penicillium oxalicum]
MQKLAQTVVDSPNVDTIGPADEWIEYFAWDTTANGFIDQEKDVDSLITDLRKGPLEFVPVSQLSRVDAFLHKTPIYRMETPLVLSPVVVVIVFLWVNI